MNLIGPIRVIVLKCAKIFSQFARVSIMKNGYHHGLYIRWYVGTRCAYVKENCPWKKNHFKFESAVDLNNALNISNIRFLFTRARLFLSYHPIYEPWISLKMCHMNTARETKIKSFLIKIHFYRAFIQKGKNKSTKQRFNEKKSCLITKP